jgi:DNA-binding CsgD family transcriptional regulator
VTRKACRPWTRKDLEQAHKWRQEGCTVDEVAQRLSRTPISVVHALSYWTAKGLLSFRRRKRAVLRDYQRQLVRLHKKGMTDTAIAKELGVRRDTVGNWRNKLGLPSNAKKYDWRGRYERQLSNAGVSSLVELRWRKIQETENSNGCSK